MSARRVYSAEQLHQLRASSSAPKLREAIEELDGEVSSAVREHVLRGSKSFAARSLRSRGPLGSLYIPPGKPNDENAAISADPSHELILKLTNGHPPVLGEIANNGQFMRPAVGPWRLRRSPTPSIRKKKVEALVKHHGSPQHIRVTAGGRIVPSEQSPLCHPRFGYSAIKTNGGLVKVVPNHRNSAAQWTQATQDGFIAQDVDGRLCQIVNGTIMPLQQQDGMLRLYISAPNLNITQQRGASVAVPNNVSNLDSLAPAGDQPSVATQKNALELEYGKLDHELKDLNKTEVLHSRSMGRVAKDALIAKRRELVISMDKIRKALKSLNDLPQDAQMPPTSPRAMRATSPQGRLPPFLNRFRQSHSISGPPPPPHMSIGRTAHPSFAPPQSGGPYAYPALPIADGALAATVQPFELPQAAAAGMYMQLPPFDSEMAPFSTYQNAPLESNSGDGDRTTKDDIPQGDGSHSYTEAKKSSVPTPPRQSHALPIKDPETKQVTTVKSTLNPMSPVYKPAFANANGASKTSAAPSRPANKKSIAVSSSTVANHATQVAASTGDHTTSPAKKSKRVIVHSSSVSSIKTADFFPRNTREYSMRKHEYPTTTDSSEDKENADPDAHSNPNDSAYTEVSTANTRFRSQSPSPVTPTRALHNTNWNPEIPDGAFARFASPPQTDSCNPTAPPGTPVDGNWTRHSLADNGLPTLPGSALPDRSTHNLSPKNKRRTWHFIQEHPSQYGSEDVASSPMKKCDRREELCVTESLANGDASEGLDLRTKSSTWIEGFQAGLYRRAVGVDKMGDFLAGYCAGLLKSEVVTSVFTGLGATNGSLIKSLKPGHQPTTSRPPFETTVQSMDTLKQAVFAPQNENAVLTPAIDGPYITDAPLHPGAWQKKPPNISVSGKCACAQSSCPQRSSSVADKPAKGTSLPLLEQRVASLSVGKHIDQTHHQLPSERLNSITSIDSTLYRPWPSNNSLRVISPFEWKSQSSVSHAAELATGYFAHAQFDGTAPDRDTADERAGMLTHAAGFAGAPSHQHSSAPNGMQTAELYGRFREASLDGMSSSPVTSPPLSPRVTPAKMAIGKKKDRSPVKEGSSPAKAKFADIAGKVGIKVSAEKKEVQIPALATAQPTVATTHATDTPSSPPGKKRWRDIWHGSRKDGGA